MILYDFRWIWAGRSMKMEDFQKKSKKMRKKSKNFSKKFFFQKKFLCHFLIPDENWGEKNFFSREILFLIFRPVLAQKNTYAFSARGRRGWENVEKMRKKSKTFSIFFQKKLCHFLIPGENWGENFFSCLDFVPDFSTYFGPKKYLAFSARGWICSKNQ